MKISSFLLISRGLAEVTWEYDGIKKEIFDEHLKMWDVFRDPVTGLYCDSEKIDSGRRCGRWGNLYNQGATGWGLQVNCIEVELGIRTREEGIKRSLQTIRSFKNWPRDPCTGIFSRFTSRKWQFSGEWATIGSALATSGMMFAGNYFGGEVLEEAKKLLDVSAYDRTVVANDSISIMMVADGDDTMSATNAALSEYAALAYLAAVTEDSEIDTKCTQFHEKFHTSINGADPAGMAEHGRPDRFDYFGHDVISGPYGPYSTFTPLFAWLSNKALRVGEENKAFWKNALNNWYLAELDSFEEFNSDPDQVMWSLGNNATDRGEPVNIHGKVFGCGAGSSAGGYEATTMKNNEFKTFSPHIMMAFLRVVDDDSKVDINDKIEYLWTTKAGRSRKEWGLFKEKQADFLWRNSLLNPELQINRVEAVDYGSGLIGYAANFLPDSWFEQFMI